MVFGERATRRRPAYRNFNLNDNGPFYVNANWNADNRKLLPKVT